jgi:hypothetical protein
LLTSLPAPRRLNSVDRDTPRTASPYNSKQFECDDCNQMRIVTSLPYPTKW